MKSSLKGASVVSFLSLIIGFGVAPQPASAVVISVPGQGVYNIQIQETAFPSLIPPATQMPWWGNQPLANAFATALGSSLGPVLVNVGPFFAWGVSEAGVEMDAFCIGAPCFDSVGVADTAFSFAIGNLLGEIPEIDLPYSWAIATPVTSNVPGPLPLFGAAAAFGISRKLRRRMNSRKTSAVMAPPERSMKPSW